MNVPEMISQLRTSLLDDANNGPDARWSDVELRALLSRAAQKVVTDAIAQGYGEQMRTTVSLSPSGDSVTLPLYETILSVFQNGDAASSSPRTKILPASSGIEGTPVFLSSNITVDLCLKNTFPSDDVTQVQYCQQTVRNTLMDQVVILQAALDAKTKEGDDAGSSAIMRQLQDYKFSLFSVNKTPQIYVVRPRHGARAYGSSYYTSQITPGGPKAYWYESAYGTLRFIA